MGGRSRANVPLPVLRQQLSELAVFLANAAWIEALGRVRVDAPALVRELEGVAAEAAAALVALRLARDDVAQVTHQRNAWRAAYKGWAREIRAALDVVGPAAPEADAEVRRRLGRYPGRTFTGSREHLELALAALRTFGRVLCVSTWQPDPIASGERLLAQGGRIAADGPRTKAARIDRSREVAAVTRRARHLLGRVRAAWALASKVDRYLPDLPLDTLAAYRPTPRPRPEEAPTAGGEAHDGPSEENGEFAPLTCESAPLTREVAPLTREVTPLTREVAPLTSEVTGVTPEGDP